MGTQYSHLSQTDRVRIEVLMHHGAAAAAVARLAGFHRSTIYREIKRAKRSGWSVYNAHFGQLARELGRKRAGLARRKLGPNLGTPLWQHVLAGLHASWSPEQIAGRLRLVPDLINPSSRPVFSVSHETIYCAIYAMPRGALRTELVKLLRKSHSGRLPRARGQARFTGVQNMTPIALRPPEVAARIVPGHWEGDLIKGARNASSVGTLVERSSRYLMLAKLDSASSDDVLEGFTRRLRTVPDSLRKTLTYDQGTEMAQHQTLAKRLHIDIFFCDPHSPWQRGTNENSNGLLREYLPKGVDLSHFNQQQLSAIEYSLNNRPRKILGFKTPYEVFSQLKLNNITGVALQA